MAVATDKSAGGRFALRRPALPPWFSPAAAAVCIFVAAVLPLFFQQASGFIDDSTLALAYTVMALGLNVVVGFAGLLDLGYLAFFAIGALCTGWFSSGFYSNANVHVGVSKFQESLPGIHLNWLLVVVIAMRPMISPKASVTIAM